MLFDQATITVQAGNGGDGSLELSPGKVRPLWRARTVATAAAAATSMCASTITSTR